MLKNLRYFLAFYAFFYCAYGSEDKLIQALKTAESGAQLQALRMRVASENMAHSSSIGLKGKNPYKRKVVIASSSIQGPYNAKVIRYKVVNGKNSAKFKRKYDPHHPYSNKDGYVLIPNIDKDIERADAAEAQVSYQANLKVIKALTEMTTTTIELAK